MALDLLEQARNAVEVDFRARTEVSRTDFESFSQRRHFPLEASTKRLIENSLERLAGPTHFAIELCSDIVIECHRGAFPHSIMMLTK